MDIKRHLCNLPYKEPICVDTRRKYAIMMNRKWMIASIAAGTAAVISLGSVYASVRSDGLSAAQTGETEEEETETETEELSDLTVTVRDDPEYEKNSSDNDGEEYILTDGFYEAAMDYAMEAEAGAFYSDIPVMNWNTEEYSTVDESGFKDVKLYPLSTFGMDVDTASYALLRRNTLSDSLQWMPKDAVRIEEMINYFNYDYELPQGDDTFSITAEIADCPWNEDTKLMLVALQARDIPEEEIPDQNLVFLVDTSGSMYDQDKLPLAVNTLKYLMNSLDENDSIAIVTYAGSSEIALEPTKCTEEGKAEIGEALDRLSASGGTYGEAGIRSAYDLARDSFIEGGNNRILLLTDGDFNLGQTDNSELVDLVREKAEGQIFLSILGFGDGNYNDSLAEELADKGNGNYSYIDSDMEARRVMGAALKGTLNTVAKDAKIQLDFNPALIKGYRLIGYENRAMDAEDFEDDTKDGGEVGAGQQVTVLYELVMSDSDFEIPTAQSRYTQDETEADPALNSPADNEYLTVSIRYKAPDAEESELKELAVTAADETGQMSDNMSWAAGVAQVGMLLRDSEYAGSSDYEDVRDRLKSITGDDDFRDEFVYLIGRFENAELPDDSDGYYWFD